MFFGSSDGHRIIPVGEDPPTRLGLQIIHLVTKSGPPGTVHCSGDDDGYDVDDDGGDDNPFGDQN